MSATHRLDLSAARNTGDAIVRGLYTILTKATNLQFIAIGYGRLVFRPVRWM